ncbi:MAG TPA: helix-hairpin-helix domain-containing protein [Pyrinomonadaceae bacterium]|nr:helix-hairpin-helix domain-containing protein [Pyrinomonadaceae bacterium]
MKQFIASAKNLAGVGLLIAAALVVAGCGTQSGNTKASRLQEKSSPAPLHININTASAQELEQLPGVGKVIAERIVSYREQNGRFKRREDVIMVDGISEKKYEEIRSMIVVE